MQVSLYIVVTVVAKVKKNAGHIPIITNMAAFTSTTKTIGRKKNKNIAIVAKPTKNIGGIHSQQNQHTKQSLKSSSIPLKHSSNGLQAASRNLLIAVKLTKSQNPLLRCVKSLSSKS